MNNTGEAYTENLAGQRGDAPPRSDFSLVKGINADGDSVNGLEANTEESLERTMGEILSEVSRFPYATRSMTAEIKDFLWDLSASWQSIPKPSFASCLASDLRTSAKAYSVVLSDA